MRETFCSSEIFQATESQERTTRSPAVRCHEAAGTNCPHTGQAGLSSQQWAVLQNVPDISQGAARHILKLV